MASAKKPSLFAQRMQDAKKSKQIKACKSLNEGLQPTHQINTDYFGETSNICMGPDSDLIHQENIKTLMTMTPQEIEEERQKLLFTMDPSIVEFLKSKKSTQPRCVKKSENRSTLPDVMKSSEETLPMVQETPAADLLNKFPHMDVVEPEKLQWMQDPPQPKPPTPGCPYNARFNFDGELLPYSDDKHLDGLHHHGEEPERPGYTLQELIQLSRSSMLQQRITSLSTLANIFLKTSDYDYCLDQPLLPQLLNSELYLLLRFSLDDPVRSVVSAAVAAISNLLVNIKDEGCLDRLLGLSTGLRQPSFFVNLDLKPNELAELKDTELLKIDVIRGTLRTHLLPRFRYILEKQNPEPVEIGHILRCLVRIARHSHECALSIENTPELLAVVRKLLNGYPPFASSDALKLFRVMASQSQSLASHLVSTYNIMEPIQRFIAGAVDETNMSLTLESFYTWQLLLTYQLTSNYVSQFSPVIKRLLVTHAETISLDSSSGDLEHATALVSWITCVARGEAIDCARQCLPVIQLCALKWLSQAALLSFIKWSACKLLDVVLQCLATFTNKQGFKNAEIEQKVVLFMKSDNFLRLSQKLRKHSWLLEGEKSPSKVDILPCLGSVPPTLFDSSPLPLTIGLAVFVYAVQTPKISEQFATTEGIQKYLEEVVSAGVKTTTAHWFARQEIVLIYTLLQIHLNIQSVVESNLIHQAALFLSTSIHGDDRYMLSTLFEQVVFNKYFFSPDVNDVAAQMENLQLNEDCVQKEEMSTKRPLLLNEALDSLHTICRCYLRELGLEGLSPICPPPTLTASHNGIEPALPADWYYLPIVHLNNTEGKREDVVEVALCCLQWTLIVECLRPQYVSSLSVTSRYCRLACVLLIGTDLFREVRSWLKELLQALLIYNENINFEQPIPGLQSFYDFYRQILEQFVGVSYGDPVFGQFVLIPLQQQQSSRLKKLVWCELGAVLRFLSTPIEQIGIPIERFLEPCETDPDLLFIYLKALGQGRVRETFCPVLHRVAVHHVATFVSLHSDQPAAHRLRKMIEALGNQELKNLLLNYEQNHS